MRDQPELNEAEASVAGLVFGIILGVILIGQLNNNTVDQSSAQLAKDNSIEQQQPFRPRSSLDGQSVSAIPARNLARSDAPPGE